MRSSEIWRCTCFVISAYLWKYSELKEVNKPLWLGETWRFPPPFQLCHVCMLTHHMPPKSMLILVIHSYPCLSLLFFAVGVSLLSSNSYSSLNYILNTLEEGTHTVSHQFAHSSVSRRQWKKLSLSFFPLVLLFLGNTVSTAPEEWAVPGFHKLALEILFCHHALLSSASWLVLPLHLLEWICFGFISLFVVRVLLLLLLVCLFVCLWASLLANCPILEGEIWSVWKEHFLLAAALSFAL